MTIKIRQIAATEEELYALDDSGQIWILQWAARASSWQPIESPSGDEPMLRTRKEPQP